MVIYHLSGDEQHVIPELTKRSLKGDYGFDVDPDEVVPVTKRVEYVSVPAFVTSEFAHSRYHFPDDGSEISWVEADDETREEIIADFKEAANQLVLLQVSVTERDGTESTLSMLVDDFPLGYVEVLEIWKGESTRGLLTE